MWVQRTSSKHPHFTYRKTESLLKKKRSQNKEKKRKEEIKEKERKEKERKEKRKLNEVV